MHPSRSEQDIPAAGPEVPGTSRPSADSSLPLSSPFQAVDLGPHHFGLDTSGYAAPTSSSVAFPRSPSSPLSPQQEAAFLHTQRSLPSRQRSPMALEAERLDFSAHSSAVSLETVLSCLTLTPAELAGPSEVRTLLPGVSLRAHGREGLGPAGNELSVIMAPKGFNLKDALDRLSSVELVREPSFALGGRYVMPSSSAASQQQAQGQANASSRPSAVTVPAGPAAAPRDAGMPGSRRPVSPTVFAAGPPAADSASLPGSRLSAPDRSAASSWQHLVEGFKEASLHGVAPRESSTKENRVHSEQVAQQDRTAVPEAGAEAQLKAAQLSSPEPSQPAAVEPPEPAIAESRQATRQQRPWTVDGTPDSLAVAELRVASLDAQWRSRLVLRMWPMLAPFVPRLLREDILSPNPKCRTIAAIMTDASDAGPKLASVMKPCVELLPAAVMIADITGFTALTEALSTKGGAGVELLTKCMNRYFSQVIELLLQFNGDVMKFAGDSMIVAFWPTAEEAASQDGGLKAATLRAATCASELADKFGAMRMLPTGEAIPVPRSDRDQGGPEMQAAEGEWFEDMVHRAQGLFVTGQEHLMGAALRPVSALIQGAAKPVGVALYGAAKPVSSVVQGSMVSAVSRGTTAAAAASTIVPRVSSRLRHRRGLSSEALPTAPSLPASPIKRVQSSPDICTSEASDEAAQGSASVQRGALTGVEEQQAQVAAGATTPIQRGMNRRLAHSRSIASGLVSKLAQAATPSMGMLGGPRRTRSDAAPLHQGLPQGEAAPNASTVLSVPRFQDSLSRPAHVSMPIRPPELPHRGNDEQIRAGVAAGATEDGSSVPDIPRPVFRASTAPADVLRARALELHSTPLPRNSPHLADDGQPPPQDASTSHGALLDCCSQFESDTAPSASNTSFTSALSLPQPALSGQPGLQNFAALPPIKPRVTEEDPEQDGYDVVTVTAATGSLQPPAAGSTPSQPTASVPFSTEGAPAMPDSFAWSRRFHKLVKQARKAPKNLWRMSLGDKLALQSNGDGLPSAAAPRTASNLSTASGISNLESLAELSRRVRSTAGQGYLPQGSPPSSPSRHFLGRRPMSTSQPSRALPQGMSSKRQEDMLLLSLKVMVGAGTVCAFHVGGGHQSSVADSHGTPRWEFFIGDPPRAVEAEGQDGRPPIAQLADIESFAYSGEVVLSQEVAELVGGACLVEQLSAGAVRLLTVVERYEAGAPLDYDSSMDSAGQETAREIAALAALPDALQGRALQMLRMHLLENVRLRIEAGHIDYVNEIRGCTVLFLGFPSLNRLLEEPPDSLFAAAETELAKVQQAVEVLQRKMRQYDGSFVQFRADEKGFLAICAFGLPGRTHEDDPARGIQAALAIVDAMEKRGGQAVVGVTTGQLFCAMVGSRRRSEYTAFGDAINLSARLMVKAKEGLARVLCDSPTQHLAQSKAQYLALEPLHVKGKRLAVQIFTVSSLHSKLQPQLQHQSPSLVDGKQEPQAVGVLPQLAEVPRRWMSTHYSGAPTGSTAASMPMIGRDAVLKAVVRRVGHMVEQRSGGVILIEGEPGMGKTRLVEELQQSELGGLYDHCNMFAGAGRADRKTQSFYPWRRIFRELFIHDRAFGQLYCPRDGNPQQHQVVITELGRRLRDAQLEYDAWLYLLADALDLPLSDFPVPPPHGDGPLALQSLAAIVESGADSPLLPAPSRALRDDEREFVVDLERPRSFAVRVKRSASATQAHQGRQGSPPRHTLPKLPPPPDSPASRNSDAASESYSQRSKSSSKSLTRAGASLARQGSNWSMHSLLMRAATARGLPSTSGYHAAADKELSGHLKTKKVLELLVAIIRHFTEAYGPLILILEDLHFFDSSSWRLLGAALDDLDQQVLFVTTSRPFLGDLTSLRQLATKEVLYHKIQAAYRHVLQKPSTLHVVLQPFNIAETQQFISLSLGGMEVGGDIARLVWEKSNGLPAFIEQLVVYLKMQLGQPQATLAHQAVHQGKGGLGGQPSITMTGPDLVLHAMDVIRNTVTIHSTITDRVDRLRPEEQLTLKVASVAGLTIYADLLQVAHPRHPIMQQIESNLSGLEAANFMRQDPAEPITWRFSQVLARDVVYDLIPVGQRRDWHGRLAFAMELCQGEHNLPASTIAFHWTASCKGIEATRWWRTMKAIEYWEKSALEAISCATYADGLPLLQKAQDLASVLVEHFGSNEQSVARNMSQAVAQPANLHPLPSGLVARPSSSSMGSMDSIHGSLQGGAAASQVTMPLVPHIRRIHWERCMAAMCIAAEISVQSLNQAMLHCLRALMLLGVPMPWDQEYRARKRWWHCSFDACLVAGMCCFSNSLLKEEGAGSGEASHHVGEQEMADLAWLSRPGTLLTGSIGVSDSLLVQQGQQQDSTAFQSPSTFASGALRSIAGDFDADLPPAAEAADHVEWWQRTQLPAAMAAASQTQGSGPPLQVSRQAPGPAVLLTPPQQQEKEEEEEVTLRLAAEGQSTGASLPLLSPFANVTAQPFRSTSTEGAASYAVVSGTAAPAAPAGTGPVEGHGVGPNEAHLQEPSVAAPADVGRIMHLPGHAVQQMQPPSDDQAGVWACEPAQTSGEAAFTAAAAGPGVAEPAQDASTPGIGADSSALHPPMQHMGVVAQQSSQPQLGLPASPSVPSRWLRSRRGYHGSGEGSPEGSLRHQLSGTGGRLSGEEAIEAVVVLEILCSVLLMPEQLDVEALKYVMWVCRWLEGKHVREGSLYYFAWLDCASALHHQRHRARPGIFTLKPLLSMAGFVFSKASSAARGR